MNSNSKTKAFIQVVIVLGIAFYNYTAVININSITDRISYLDNKIALTKFQDVKIPDLLSNNKKNISYIKNISKNFEGDVDYLESLDKIKNKSKTYNITVSELSAELKDNLSIPQGAFENYNKSIERYKINLKVSGSYLNIGNLLDDLYKSDYLLSSMKINRISNSRVTGFFTMYDYISKPLKNADISTVNFDKAIRNTPQVVNSNFDKNTSWGKNIFFKTKKIIKPRPNNRAYYLTEIKLSANPSVIINGKAYLEGSVLDIYTVKDITSNSVTLTSSKKSIVLQLERETSSEVGASGFKKEFIKARRNGQSYFEYKGKLYSTDLNN